MTDDKNTVKKNDDKKTDAKTDDRPIEVKISSARSELESTLNEIEARLNVPKRVKASYKKNAAPWIAGSVGTAAGIAAVVIVAVTRRSK